jgi:hypothetical protein
VHRITVWLDRKYDWRSKPLERSVMQFVFGIGVPALTDLLLISIYFEFLGQNIVDNKFLLIDFPVIVAFITILNLYYVIHYLVLTEAKTLVENKIQAQNDTEKNFDHTTLPENITKMLHVDYHGQHLQLDVSEDVLCFYRSGKNVLALTVHGTEYGISASLSALEQQFGHLDFLRINRSVIINASTILGYANSEKKYSFKIILKPQYRELIETGKASPFFVTKEYWPLFRQRFPKL